MIFLGIDLHSNNFTCCFIFQNNKKKILKTFKLTSKLEIEDFFSMLTLNTIVMIEASTNTFKFVKLLQDRVKDVYVANTHKLKLISLVKKKTDKIDAEKLAIFLKMQITTGEELIRNVYIPDEKIQDLRGFFTTYNLLKKQIGQIKNRIHALLKQNLFPFTKEYIFGKARRKEIKKIKIGLAGEYQINILFDSLERLEANKSKIEDAIKCFGQEYYKEINILTSMRGISILSAIAIIADIGTIKRFPNSKHFTSYLRSAPGVDSSNDTVRVTKTTKFGRKLSVVFLSQALNHFRDSNIKLNRWYLKKIDIEKNKKGKIRMALCRKVFTEIYQMLKKEEYHYYRDIDNHNKKMKSYKIFLEKQDIFKIRA